MSIASPEETRKEQYLRILKQKHIDQDDYEAARYLKDNGYTDSHISFSKIKSTHGQVNNVIWKGPSSNGLDFIDELESEIDQANHPSQHRISDIKQQTTRLREWHETFWGKVIFTLAFSFISIALTFIFL